MAVCIKASGIHRLTDARYLNALETDTFLGFSFDALDPAAVTVEQAKAIIQWLYEPAVVAGFGLHQDTAEISCVLEQIGAAAIQVPAGHPLAAEEPERITFLPHTVSSPDIVPVLPAHDKLFHMLDLSDGHISLAQLSEHPRYGDWHALLQQEQVLLKAMPNDYTVKNHLQWQPFGWVIAAPLPGDDTDLVDVYGEFLENLL
jgi:hypothetical protein